MSTAYQVAACRLYHGRKPERDAKYLRFVRSHPCAVCGIWRGVESAHSGPRGLSTRADDRSAIPLCHKHHRVANDSLHTLGPVRFEDAHELSIASIQAELQTEFDRWKGGSRA